MRHSVRKLCFLFIVAVVISAIFPSSAIAGESEKEVTITGVVKKATISSRGEVRSVYIHAEDESILVSRLVRGKELLGHIGSTVTVTGIKYKVRNDMNFKNAIDVTAFTVDNITPQKPPQEPAEENS